MKMIVTHYIQAMACRAAVGRGAPARVHRLALLALVVMAAGCASMKNAAVRAYSRVSSPSINRRGGDITIRNARIWTGDPADPWKDAMTIRGGVIVAMDAKKPAGNVVDAQGRLILPGFWESHCHPQVPYTLVSPEAPMLMKSKTVDEVLEKLRAYVKAHPGDSYPRLFGWMSSILPEGEFPTREMIDAVVSDRPVFLVHNTGHMFWANTKALEAAGALEADPPEMPPSAIIHRDPETGLATGYLEESEYAATDGILLRSVKKVHPLTFAEQVLIQRIILDMYSAVGVTAIWQKDGDLDVTRVYEQILRDDALPVRAVLDALYTGYNKLDYFQAVRDRADEIANSDLPKGFLRSNAVKLLLDMVADSHQAWMFDPYVDGRNDHNKPVFDLDYFRQQMWEADRLGLQINALALGDRAVHEFLNLVEQLQAERPRDRRPIAEHAEFIQDADLPRFKQTGTIVCFNTTDARLDRGYRDGLASKVGEDRLRDLYQRWRDALAAGAVVVNGSDFPLGPMDPMVNLHVMVNGTDAEGHPPGGLWPHKQITIEEAVRIHTVHGAYAAFEEERLGRLKSGYLADFVMLSDDILASSFDSKELLRTKVVMTVFNGHRIYQDFSRTPKVIEFGD